MCLNCPNCRTTAAELHVLGVDQYDSMCLRCVCTPVAFALKTRKVRGKPKPTIAPIGRPSFGKADDQHAAEKLATVQEL